MQKRQEFLNLIAKEGKVRSWNDYAKMFNFDNGEAARKFYGRNKHKADIDIQPTYVVDKETNTAHIESNRPLTTEQAVLDYCKLSTKDWEVKEIWTKEKQTKDLGHPMSSNGVLSLYETTAKILPKASKSADYKEDFLSFVKNYTPTIPEMVIKVGPKKEDTTTNALILSLTDLHLDKKTHFEETEEHGEIDLIKSRALNACFDLVDRARASHELSKIIIIGGNDYFHANSAANTTQKGTPLDVDGRWHESFKEGLTLMTTIIDYCSAVAPVEYFTVLGNHSPEREWYLSVALEAFYRLNSNVQIETINKYRKYFTFGRSAFMLTHEVGSKVKDLPLIFATERPEMFARSKYRTVLTGHLHKQHETQFVSTNENFGIVFKILPSLCATDKWHYDNNFTGNQKSCIALVVNEDYGTIAELIYNE